MTLASSGPRPHRRWPVAEDQRRLRPREVPPERRTRGQVPQLGHQPTRAQCHLTRLVGTALAGGHQRLGCIGMNDPRHALEVVIRAEPHRSAGMTARLIEVLIIRFD